MTVQAPRFELPISDKSGRVTREWYKFLVQMANSLGPSLTGADDLQNFQNLDSAAAESQAISANNAAKLAQSMILLLGEDQPKPPDTSLLAWWPGDVK